MAKLARILYALTALIAAVGLALQLWLLIGNLAVEGVSVGGAIWRFFGFFTILTNCAVAVAAALLARNPSTEILGPKAKLSITTAIVLVGLVYSIALRSLWEPVGLQAVVDRMLHDVTPVLFLLAWALGPRGVLAWRDGFWALLAPAAYCIYALARGAFDGWYAYFFLDPNTLSMGEIAVNIAGMLVFILGIASALILLDRFLARKAKRGA